MTEHKWTAILHAIADGKEVEWSHPGEDNWRIDKFETRNPLAHPDLDWRLKPEPNPDIVWYMSELEWQNIE